MTNHRQKFLDNLPPAPQEHVHHIPATSTAMPAEPKRPGRQPAHRRKRDWEQRHRPFTFVGVPQEIREAICDLAAYYREQFGMVGGVDAVARELLRYSLAEYGVGRLKIPLVGNKAHAHLTAYPGWGDQKKPIPARKSKPKKSKAITASYRLPDEQLRAIRAIPELEAERAAPRVIHLPLGQVVTCLLEHALTAYREGRWVLETVPEMTVQGLRGETP